jgi:hypothetical protein
MSEFFSGILVGCAVISTVWFVAWANNRYGVGDAAIEAKLRAERDRQGWENKVEAAIDGLSLSVRGKSVLKWRMPPTNTTFGHMASTFDCLTNLTDRVAALEAAQKKAKG